MSQAIEQVLQQRKKREVAAFSRKPTSSELAQLTLDLRALRRSARALLAMEKKKPADRAATRHHLARKRKRLNDTLETLGRVRNLTREVGMDPAVSSFQIGQTRVSLNDIAVAVKQESKRVGRDLQQSESVGRVSQGLEKEKEEKKGHSGFELLWAGLIAAVAAIGAWLGSKLTELFNETDDDDARKWAGEATCQKIMEATDEDLVGRINAMLDGPTGDDDEGAILRILGCLPNDRRKRIAERVTDGDVSGVEALEDNIDGEEAARLITLLVECGLRNFADMDDDGARDYVNTHDNTHLGALPIEYVATLVLHMFSGYCSDDDEDMIVKLMKAQSTARLQQIVAMPGLSTEEFDDNVDGAQWDELAQWFNDNGIPAD